MCNPRSIDARGPRFLYIHGPSQNGKSTFLRFALKLLTSRDIEPLPHSDFSKGKIRTASSLGSVFPLVFDDVTVSQSPGIEEVLKSHWEVWWKQGQPFPQIIMSSNTSRLKEWAKSLVKKVDFDVHFAPTEESKLRLSQVFQQDNPLFRWFSLCYLDFLAAAEAPSDDELRIARESMKKLYEHANRPLPDFFPQQSLEQLYDPGRRDWNDLLQLRKAKSREEKGRILIELDRDMQVWEVQDLQSQLPPTVKCVRRGNTLIIESPNEFKKWLEGQPVPRRSWLSRVFSAIGPKSN